MPMNTFHSLHMQLKANVINEKLNIKKHSEAILNWGTSLQHN